MSGRPKSRALAWRDAVRDSGLDKTAKLVAFTLSTYMKADGSAFPGVGTLARGASLTDRAVQAALRRLEREGWLYVEWSRGGPRRTHHFVARLSTTVNELRRFEWSNGARRSRFDPEGDAHNPERWLDKPEGASEESAESAESGACARTTRGAPAYVEDCPGCGESFETDDADAAFCPNCEARAAA